jgi:glycosyltransferase involved in cell wall biosynthesis
LSICFISPYSPRTVNGIGSFLVDLSKYIKAKGHSIILITKHENEEISVENLFDLSHIIEIKHTKLKNLASIHFTFLVILSIFKIRNKVDVLHLQQAYMLSTFSAIFGKLLGKKVVTTVHVKAPESKSSIKKLFNSIFIRTTIICSDMVVYVSEETKKSFNLDYGIVIKNGIDTNHFFKNSIKRIQMKKRLQLENHFILLFAGRWTNNKGIFQLLKAFSIVRKTTTENLMLVLIGSGEKERVLSEIQSLGISGNVLLIGPVNRQSISDYYCMSDIFILPSEFEGLPMALLEAMSCGLPSIVSRVGGNPELISSGKNGFLIEPNNLEELVETILWCLDHQRDLESIGQSAAETVREKFSMEMVADEYIDVYNELLVG